MAKAEKNPFIYGEIVKGECFADREDELRELVSALEASQKIFLISPRRYGKTSLIFKTLDNLKKKGFLCVYVDLFRISSLKQFLEIYTKELTKNTEKKVEAMIRLMSDILRGLRPKTSIDLDGTLNITIDYTPKEEDVYTALDSIYESPWKISRKKKKKVVVVFDEFQELISLAGEKIEKPMRAAIQHQRNVGYVFAGSKKQLLYDMVSNKNRAFYKMGKTMILHKIPREKFKPFLEKKFISTGFKLGAGVVEKILDLTEDCPYNAQYLCSELWEGKRSVRKIKADDVEKILDSIIVKESPLYEALWDTLSSHQKRLMKAISIQKENMIYSRAFIEENELATTASVTTSVNALIKKGFLDKEKGDYAITDNFFKYWIARA